VATPEDHPLPDSWGAQLTRTLTVDETGKLLPSVTFNAPMRKPCFLIGGQPNSLGGIFTVRQKPINLAERFQLQTWVYGALGGRSHLLRYQ
jgi:hypothetical protein